MEILGIKFAPLNVPLERRLQTLAAATWFVTMAFGGFIGLLIALYLIFYTSYWILTLAYVIWIILDRNTCEQGGRRSEWVRGWTWWKYFKNYFPTNLVNVSEVELDKKKNYLFCTFPHGMLSTGAFSSFGTTHSGFNKLFPNHTSYCMTLTQHFHMPFFRELAFGLGGCAASAKSINWLLSTPEGGCVLCLVVGGASESFNCRPGEYRILLKNRKGFVKQALKCGASLVPVFSFGETDLFSQVNNPEGSILRYVQEALRKVIGIAPALPMGRGFFQYSFGLIPLRKPVTTVVGTPIDLVKNKNPTQEEIDELHSKFIDSLVKLFEEHKHKYLQNANEVELVIQ